MTPPTLHRLVKSLTDTVELKLMFALYYQTWLLPFSFPLANDFVCLTFITNYQQLIACRNYTD